MPNLREGSGSGAALGSLVVLAVDDDPYQLKVSRRLLSNLGVSNFYEASSGKLALSMASSLRGQLDVVICDLNMPDTDGMEFLRLLAGLGLNASVLILSSAGAGILRSVELMAREYGLHVLGAISKPLKALELEALLALRLQHRAGRQRLDAPAESIEEIREALQLQQFDAFFQPKVEFETYHVCGAEALARWRHPTRGILSAARFMELVEENGLIEELTGQILNICARQVRIWNDAGLRIPVSINLSPLTVTDTDLPRRFREVVARHGVSPEQFIFEVTETFAITDIGHSLETLSRLRLIGAGLSVDDFGAGHSSLQKLSSGPWTELKIDMAFVTGAHSQPHLYAIAESSVSMSHRLGLKSVAEGIETKADWDCLRALGCDIAQGYLISRPMDGSQFLDWKQDWDANASKDLAPSH